MKNRITLRALACITMLICIQVFCSSAQTVSISRADILAPAPEGDTVSILMLRVSDPEAVHIISIDYLKDNKEFSGESESYFVSAQGDAKYLHAQGKEIIPLGSEDMSFKLKKKKSDGYIVIQIFDKNYKSLAKSELVY